MKRLWIRAHALTDVAYLTRRVYVTSVSEEQALADDWMHLTHAPECDPNDMVVVEISDRLAAEFPTAGYLITCGKVLADDEEPPYLGSDPSETRRRG